MMDYSQQGGAGGEAAGSRYHYTGAQGSFGSTGAGGAGAPPPGGVLNGAGEVVYYGHNGYQAQSEGGGGGSMPGVAYTAVPPPPKRRRRGRKLLTLLLGTVGLAAVVGLSMAAGAYLTGWQPAAGGNAANPGPEHLIVSASPQATATLPENTAYSESGALTTPQIAAKVTPSVVGINLYSDRQVERVSTASGIVLDTDGHIITNAHVVSDGYSPTVVLADGSEITARLVGYDTRTDLAVLKIDPQGLSLQPAEFGDSDALAVGQKVVAIGNANGYYNSVSQGIVSGLARDVSTNISLKLIQTDAAINPGNSGGALVNEWGQVVGINSSKMAGGDIDSMGFAIPIADAKPIIDSLINYGYVKDRVALGVTVIALNDVNGALMGLPDQGLYITQIDPASDLYAQGVTRGDVLLTAGEVTLTRNSDLIRELENYKPGDTVRLTVRLGTGETVTVNAKLHEMTGSS